MHRRRCGDVLVPEALTTLVFRFRGDQERLDPAGAESHGSACLLVDLPGPPVEVELHRVRTEVKGAADPRPLVKGFVQKPVAEAIFSLIEYGPRRRSRVFRRPGLTASTRSA